MEMEQFLEDMRQGKMVKGGSEGHRLMHELSQEAMRKTAELNGSYHSPEEVREIFAQITGRPVDASFAMVSSVLYRLWKEYFRGKEGIYQLLLPLSGSGRDLYWRRLG